MSAALAIVLAIICLAGGSLLGFLLGRGGGNDKKRAEALEQEFEDYKRDVTAHFGKTAEHFQSMGRQYRELYEHMAGGASKLCEQDDRTRLAFPSLLTIEGVAETPSETEPALDAASESSSEPAGAPVDASAPAAERASRAEADAETESAEAEDEPETEPEAAAADEEAGEASDDTPTEAARALAADDGADDDLKVEVSVEVVDDDEPEPEDTGATPRSDKTGLDASDDAGATRH